MDIEALTQGVLDREARAVARAISLVEDGRPELAALSAGIYGHTGAAATIGLTGAPGVGKSTLATALVRAARADGRRVAVLAIDPTSPYTGGALLGDRVRMQEHATDPDVFIRSMATRGHLGGMALAAPEAVRILEAAGFDLVIVETVGVGQAEVDVAAATDTAVVVLAPGLGDAVQMAKAGILEVADVFIVNKADRDGAAAVVRELRQMLHLGPARPWDPPVLSTTATTDEGIGELWSTIEEHGRWAVATASSGRSSRSARSASASTSPARWTATPASWSGWYREPSTRTVPPRSSCVACETRGAHKAAMPTEPRDHATRSGIPLDPVYDRPAPGEPLPGEFPFTRGPYASMYRGRLWTMRQFAGYGTPAETNERFRLLLERGQTGLSVAFDMPTLMGLDPDDPRSEGEVGRCGVAVATLDDTETLFADIPLDEVSVSMTINGPAAWIFACYVVAAERQGVDVHRLGGTLQTDIFKEYTAQKEWLFPPRPHLRLVADLMAYCAANVPRYHPISVSGYHIREAGSTAVQELAFTLADGFAYVELGQQRGLAVDAFAPRLSFFFDAHIDLFEEVAKFRAARRIWARWLRDRYGARTPEAQRLRFHTQTAGVSLTAQQPMNNVVRTAIEALAAVLGGTQSLHTNALDEVLALPTEEAATLALRTQQVLAYETGLEAVADPLGGSYFVESLTDEVERQAEELFAEIAAMGEGSMLEGVLHGVENGWFTQRIAEAAFDEQRRTEAGGLVQVGVNAFEEGPGLGPETLQIAMATERAQIEAVERVRAERDAGAAADALHALTAAAAAPDADLIEPLIACARAHCTGGEVTETLQAVFGTWRETPAF